MSKIINNMIKKILLLLLGLSNIFPTRISIYDQYIIPIIENNLTSENPFFITIEIGIILFRILIIIATIYELYDIVEYAKNIK